MSRIARSLLQIIIGLATCFSCTAPENISPENDPVSPKDYGGEGRGSGFNYKYGDRTIPVSANLLSKMSHISGDGFHLSANANGGAPMQSGDILVFSNCAAFPDGYIAKVSSINAVNKGDDYSFTLSPVGLAEAFESLSIKQDNLDLSSHVKSITDESGNEIPFSKGDFGFEIILPGEMMEDEDKEISILDCVTLTPTIRLGVNLSYGVEISHFSLKEAFARMDLDAVLKSGISVEMAKQEMKYTTQRLTFTFAAIPVGPIVITPQLFAEIEFNLKGEISINYSVGVTSGCYVEASYKNGKMTGDGGFKSLSLLQDKVLTFEGVKAAVSLETGPNVGALLSIYGGALGIGVHGGLRTVFSLTCEPNSVFSDDVASAGMWLSNTYADSAIKLLFGGDLVLAYVKDISCDFGEGTEWDLWKYYFIPTLCPDFEIFPYENSVFITFAIQNQSFFNKSIYFPIYEVGEDGEKTFFKNAYIQNTQRPQKEGEKLVCTASADGVEEGRLYYVDGPYVDVSAFGKTWPVYMYPAYPSTLNRYFGKASAESALREKLIQLYIDTGGDNWINHENWCTDKPLKEWYGVSSEQGWYWLDLVDNNLTGSVHFSECPIIRRINLDNNAVESVTVSDCSSLIFLDLDGNNLSSVSVSGCDQLYSLFCSQNQLTTISVSGCPSLKAIGCSQNNLTALDCSGVPSLSLLACDKCKLTSLNLTGLSHLTDLICYENNLSSLDLTDCTSLTYLSCYQNNLSSLDLKSCKSLEKLYCNKNHLSSLTVQGYNQLTVIDCKDNCLTRLDAHGLPLLKKVYCDRNYLYEVNLSNCPSLEYFDDYNNPIVSLDISGCEQLMGLHLNQIYVSTINASGCKSLEEFPTFENTNLSSLDVSGCTSLTSLTVNGNRLTRLDVSGCTSLFYLKCHDNLLTDLDVTSCAAMYWLECQNNHIIREISFEDGFDYFSHDELYVYTDGHYYQNEYGWYFPGEPGKGYHGR